MNAFLADPLSSPLPLAESSKAALALLAELGIVSNSDGELQYLSEDEDYDTDEQDRGLLPYDSNVLTSNSARPQEKRVNKVNTHANDEGSSQDSIPSLFDAPDPTQPLPIAYIANPQPSSNANDISTSSLETSGAYDNDGPSFTQIPSPGLSTGIPRIVSHSSHSSMHPNPPQASSGRPAPAHLPLSSTGKPRRGVTPQLQINKNNAANSPPPLMHSLKKVSMTPGVSYANVREKQNQSASPSPVKSISPNKKKRVELGILLSPVKQPDFGLPKRDQASKANMNKVFQVEEKGEQEEEEDEDEETPPMVIPDSQPPFDFGKALTSRSSSSSGGSGRDKAGSGAGTEINTKDHELPFPGDEPTRSAGESQILVYDSQPTSPVREVAEEAAREQLPGDGRDNLTVPGPAHMDRSPSVEYVQDYDPNDWHFEPAEGRHPEVFSSPDTVKTGKNARHVSISPIRLPRRTSQAGPLQSTTTRRPLQQPSPVPENLRTGMTPPRAGFLPFKPLRSLSASKGWQKNDEEFKVPDLPPSLRYRQAPPRPVFDDYTFDFGSGSGSQGQLRSSSPAGAAIPARHSRNAQREQSSPAPSTTSQRAPPPMRHATSAAASSSKRPRQPGPRSSSVSSSRGSLRRKYSTTFVSNGKRAFATPSPPFTPPASPKSGGGWLRMAGQGRQASPALSMISTNSRNGRTRAKANMDNSDRRKQTHFRPSSVSKPPAVPIKTDQLLNILPKRHVKRKRAETVDSDEEEDREGDRSFDRDSWENSNSDDEARNSDSGEGTDYDEPALVRRVSKIPNAKGRGAQRQRERPAAQQEKSSKKKKRRKQEQKDSSSSEDLTKNEEFMKGRQQRLQTYAALEGFQLETEATIM